MSFKDVTRERTVSEIVEIAACDGPGCPKQGDAPSSPAVSAVPNEWLVVYRAGDDRSDTQSYKHFCGKTCLAIWAMEGPRDTAHGEDITIVMVGIGPDDVIAEAEKRQRRAEYLLARDAQ